MWDYEDRADKRGALGLTYAEIAGLEDYFWGRIARHPTDCWVWTGPINKGDRGYGRFIYKWRGFRAHRVAYVLANGDIPDELLVCHTCDNRACCRPSHLFLGTHKDNWHDCNFKGRRPDFRGEKNPNCRISDDTVRQIRAYIKDETVAERKYGARTRAAKRFNVPLSLVCEITQNRRWSHVE